MTQVTAKKSYMKDKDGNYIIPFINPADKNNFGVVKIDEETIVSQNGTISAVAFQESRLHALKSYSDEGELFTDSEGFADVLNYAHSTFDSSKFTSLKVGSPVISADGIASGLGNNNYFNTGIVIGNKPFSITLKASWTGSITGQRIFQLGLGTYQKLSCYVQNNTNLQFGGTLSDSTTFNKAISNISGDVIINFAFDGSKYVLKASLDNGKTWSSNEYESSLYIENVDTLNLYLGNNFSAGTIDLKYLSVVVDGVTVLNGNVTSLDVIKADNYTLVGTPTISTDGVASNLGSSDYINTTQVIGQKPFKIRFEGCWSSTISARRLFQLGLGTDMKMSVFAQNGALDWGFTLSDDNTVTKVLSNVYGHNVIGEIEFTGTQYIFKGSVDGGETWTSVSETSNLYIKNIDTLVLYIGQNGADITLDLNVFQVYVDGELVYQPCLKIPYTWSKTGSKITNAVYKERLLSLYNQEGDAPYYMLDEANKQFALPMGELYGFIRRAGNDYSKPNFDSGVTITSPYTVEGGGWIRVKLDYFYNGAEFGAYIDSTNEVIRYRNNAEVDHGSATTFLIPVQIGQVFTAVINNAQTGTAAVYKYFKNKGV